MPKKIKEAYEDRRLVLFVGAGISRIAKCLGWEDLGNQLISVLHNKKDASLLNNAKLGSKEKITIALAKAKQDKRESVFWKTFEHAIQPEEPKLEIYRLLCQLNALFVTTNCDGLLEQCLPNAAWQKNCTTQSLKNAEIPAVFYIHGRYGHGSPKEKENLVFTVDQYLRKYKEEDFRLFLETLFTNYTILFLGYGMSEFELLDFLFLKSGVEPKKINHYILEGYFSYELPIAEAKGRYYQSLGIGLIPYSKDEKGYEQQLVILKEWVTDLTTHTHYQTNIIQDLRNYLGVYNDTNKDLLLYYLNRFPDSAIYLQAVLEIIPETTEPLNWLLTIWEDQYKNITELQGRDDTLQLFLKKLSGCLSENGKLTEEQACELRQMALSLVQLLQKNSDNTYHDWYARALFPVILSLDKAYEDDDLFHFIISRIENDYFFTVSDLGDEDRVCSWPKEHVKIIVRTAFASYAAANDRDASVLQYFVEHLLKREKNYAALIVSCAIEALNSDKYDDDMFWSIEERLEYTGVKASNILLDILIKAFGLIRTNDRSKILCELAQKSKIALSIQTVFYLATRYKCDLSFAHHFQNNPLDYSYVWLALAKLLESSKPSSKVSSDILLIDSWIRKASFAYPEDTSEKDVKYYTRKKNGICLYLYERLQRIDSDYKEQYEYYRKTDHANMGPRNWNVRSFNKSEIQYAVRAEDILDKTGEEALDLLTKKLPARDPFWMTDTSEEYENLIRILNDQKKLENTLNIITNRNFAELSAFCAGFVEWGNTETELPTIFWPILTRIYERIIEESDSQDKQNCIQSLIQMLGFATSKEEKQQALILCKQIQPELLWTNPKPLDNDWDVFSEFDSESEAQFYNEYIDLLYALRDLEQEEDLTWLTTRLNTASPWPKLAAAYQYAKLFFLNKSWTKQHMAYVFQSDEELVAQCVFLACANTRIVFPELTDLISSEKTMEIVFRYKFQEQYSKSYQRYVVCYLCSAFSFDQISDVRYAAFLTLIDGSLYEDLFHCIIFPKSEAKRANEDVLLYTFELLKNNSKTDEAYRVLADNVLDISDKINSINTEMWQMIEWALPYGGESRHWHNLSKMISNLKKPFDTRLYSVLKTALNTLPKPYWRHLHSVLDRMHEDNPQEALEFSNLVFQKEYYPNEITKWQVEKMNNNRD